MKILLSPTVRTNIRSLAVFIYDEQEKDVFSAPQIPSRIRASLKKMYSRISHESNSTIVLPQGTGTTQVVIVVNLGEKKDLSQSSFTRAIRSATRALTEAQQQSAAYIFPELFFDDSKIVSMVARETMLASYTFSTYRKQKRKKTALAAISIVLAHRVAILAPLQTEIKNQLILAEEVNAARELSNMPGGDMTPTVLAEHAEATGKRSGFHVAVYNEKKMKALGMGGMLGVSRGSSEEAKFIICEYAHPSARTHKPVVFIGKGVTFDTGGLNIKPEMSMYEMHMDMSGGASILHAIAAIARMKLPVHVVGLIPAAENMPSGSGYRPGDILRMYGGKTVEVKHTDAEGRILLADALGFAKTFSPDVIIDVATLTGASLVALGQRVSALLSPNKKLSDQLIAAGEASGDRVWPLPLWPEYKSDMKSDFADIANISKSKFGGTITAAAFLWEFTPINTWAHIDIAPTMTSIPEDNLASGSKGSGVNLLVTFVEQRYADSAKS